MNPGSIVRCRNRDWVLLPSDSHDVFLLRPLTGATDGVVAVHKPLTDLIAYSPEEGRVCPATFPLPMPDETADAASADLLWQAVRLTLREGVTPFRSLGRISIRTLHLPVCAPAHGITPRPDLPADCSRCRGGQDHRSAVNRTRNVRS